MGCSYEINDTLLIKKEHGFPSDVLNIEKHRENPITIADVEDMTFHFAAKPKARAYQLDPVRVFLFEWTENDKWLAWGKVFIQSLTLERKPDAEPSDPSKPIFHEYDWITSGTFKIVTIYDPEYQEIFTTHESPSAWNYFG